MLHAQRAVASGIPNDSHDAQEDAGYYLIGNGRPRFERALGFRPSPTRRLLRLCIAAATPGYLGAYFSAGDTHPGA